MPRRRKDDKKQRKICPLCNKDIAVTKAGWIMSHGKRYEPVSGSRKRKIVDYGCPASNMPYEMALDKWKPATDIR